MVLRREQRTRMRDGTESFAEVSATLWGQREAMELLVFRLTEQQVLLDAGYAQWLPQLDADVRVALQDFRLGEVDRSAAAAALAMSHGLAPTSALHQLAQIAPSPWSALLNDHHAALVALSGQLHTVARQGGEQLESYLEALELEDATGDSRSSSPETPAADLADALPAEMLAGVVIEMAACTAALDTIRSIKQLSLHDFLDD
jgi:hypothetical protein